MKLSTTDVTSVGLEGVFLLSAIIKNACGARQTDGTSYFCPVVVSRFVDRTANVPYVACAVSSSNLVVFFSQARSRHVDEGEPHAWQ